MAINVHTKLLNNTLEGPRVLDMGTMRPCQCYVIPYEDALKVSKEHLSGRYAFYILLGKGIIGGQQVYVGRTNDFYVRVLDHKHKKSWWNLALVFVSKSNDIYDSEVQYLEHLGWKSANESNMCVVKNTNPVKEPGISEEKKMEMKEFFEDIVFLTRFYGCHVFDKMKTLADMGIHELFTVEVLHRGIKGIIQYWPKSQKYSLIEGSTISLTDSSCSKKAKEVRQSLINNPEYCKIEKDFARIIQSTNIPVKSGRPSFIAEIITGTAMPGTTALVNKDGKTFAELYPNK